MLTTIEKVIFLQEVDIFEQTSTENLAQIAAITEELQIAKDHVIYQEGDNSDSMYLVVEGKIRLHKSEQNIMIAGEKDAFGTWALLDDEVRLVSAVALEDGTLLRIAKDDFYDLLADNVQITQGIIKYMAGKLRSLAGRAGK
ncbi:MAG: cyclic nucleotide-binding domain-containing protein [Deferribacteres bacterium]|nr:cyclic nucleotide-binding domain-containing protein [candidate division KSB1 bacterium]MCB9509494.1 cyclic nucleotide-binding domain-containing protein [Deferribacteres bacterium]